MTRVLVLNTGSSSVKWSLLEADGKLVASGNEPWQGADAEARSQQIRAVLRRLPPFDRVGHRVVHGGLSFRDAVVIDARVRRELARLGEMNPEHMTSALLGIDAVGAVYPKLLQIASFDTSFHATLPEPAQGYGLPFEWEERWGLRRFGFHGLSVAYAVRRTGELLGQIPARLIVCHLGSGCSVTAVRDGRSVDTTMGFSPLEGPMMATRSGSVDPGLLLYLCKEHGLSPDELRETLTTRSGLLGVSGVSDDLREVLAAADAGVARARLAYERFVLDVRRAVGAMAAVLDGVDALVFTGGIGEHQSRVRRDTAAALAFTGLEIASEANTTNPIDAEISTAGSTVRVLVIHAREDLSILRDVLRF